MHAESNGSIPGVIGRLVQAVGMKKQMFSMFSTGFQGFQQVFKALNMLGSPPFIKSQNQFSMGNRMEPSTRPEDVREKSFAANIPILRFST